MQLFNLILIITFNNFIIPKILGIILFLFLLKPLFKFMVKNLRPNGYQPFHIFKISNVYVTAFFCVMYFFIFIIGIFYLRILRSNHTFDLKPLINFFKFFLVMEDYLAVLLIIFFCMCFVFIFIGILAHIKDFFEINLLKMHLYLLQPYGMGSYGAAEETIYHKFVMDFPFLQDIASYILRPLELFTLIFPDNKNIMTIYTILFLKIFNFLRQIIKIHYSLFIMGLILIYDLYYNDFVISILFQVLPFYFIYMLWLRFTTFLHIQRAALLSDLSTIIYDLYYNSNTIKYFNISDEELNLLHLYIKFGLKGTDDLYGTDMCSFGARQLFYSRYILIESKRLIYVNKNIDEIINLQQFSTLQERREILKELILENKEVKKQ
jgi:hypothetical protein